MDVIIKAKGKKNKSYWMRSQISHGDGCVGPRYANNDETLAVGFYDEPHPPPFPPQTHPPRQKTNTLAILTPPHSTQLLRPRRRLRDKLGRQNLPPQQPHPPRHPNGGTVQLHRAPNRSQ